MKIKELANCSKILIHRKVKAPPVMHIEIESSTTCNLDCIMCKMKSRTTINRNKLISFDDVCFIMNEIKPPRVSLSHNGEPFLNPEIFRIINHIHDKGSWTSITTNLSFMPGSPRDLVKSGLNVLKISLDAATSETYQKIRRNPGFDSVINTLKSILEEKRKLSTPDPSIRVGFVIQELNYKEIDIFVKLVADLGIQSIRFYILQPHHDMLPIKFDLPLLGEKLRDAERIASQRGIQTNLSSFSADNFSLYEKLTPENFTSIHVRLKEERLKDKNVVSRCLQPWLACNVLIDGTVSPCCQLSPPDESRLEMGNIFSQSWEEIWNGESYRLFREKLKSGNSSQCIDKCDDPRGFKNLFSHIYNVLPSIK